MKPKAVYLGLSIVGAVVPYCAFISWLTLPGHTPQVFIEQLFANRISTFFALDVLLSAVALIAFIQRENLRVKIRHSALAVLATVLVGVSCGLPLFLYLRETTLEKS